MSITTKKLTHAQIHPSPHNLRTDVGDVSELAASIAGIGLLEPMIVRQNDDGFELIAGERRWTAIGLNISTGVTPADETFTCIVRSGKDADDATQTAAMIVENLHRAGLSPLEEFHGLARLAGEHAWTADQIAEQTGISLPVVKQRLKWMTLTDEQLEVVFKQGWGVEMATTIAGFTTAEIEEVFTGGTTGLHHRVDQVQRRKRHQRDVAKIRNQLRRAGHLVVGSGCGDEKDQTAAAELVTQVRATAAEAGHSTKLDTVSQYDVPEFLERTQVPVPSVFFIEKDTYRIPIQVLVVERALTEEEEQERDAQRSDYQRALAEASVTFDAERAAYDEAFTEARRAMVFDTKTAKLAALVMHHAVVTSQEHHAKQACKLLGIVQSRETLVAYAAQSAADLARAATAALLFGYQPPEIPGFDLERPQYPSVLRSHYDEDGTYVGPSDTDDDTIVTGQHEGGDDTIGEITDNDVDEE